MQQQLGMVLFIINGLQSETLYQTNDELHYLYQTIQKIHLIYVKHVLMSAQLRDYTISE